MRRFLTVLIVAVRKTGCRRSDLTHRILQIFDVTLFENTPIPTVEAINCFEFSEKSAFSQLVRAHNRTMLCWPIGPWLDVPPESFLRAARLSH